MDIPAKDLPLAEKIRECQDRCGLQMYIYGLNTTPIQRQYFGRLQPNQKWVTDTQSKAYCIFQLSEIYVAYKTGY